MKHLKFKICFSPIVENSVKLTHVNVMIITVNGGGYIGGSRELIYCTLLDSKTDTFGLLKVKEVISGDEIQINPRYIGTIKYGIMTSVYYKHNNSNFIGNERIEWYLHPTNTTVEFSTDSNLKIAKDSPDIELIKTMHL